MLENPSDSSANTATIKRYAPPNQRNRVLGRRKSGGGDRLERANSYTNDGEKNQGAAFRSLPIQDHGDPRSSILRENHVARLIALQGCCNSDAYQLLNNRWQAAMNAYEDPSTDLAERPVLYSGSGGSAWGQFRLPHQTMLPTVAAGTSSSQMNFLSELRQAMRNSHVSSDN